jgi:hypothetical protein
MESVVSYPDRGQYGNSSYRGNCSGKIIEDCISQFHLRSLSDFMVGSGTTEDVVHTLGLKGTFTDLNRGYDMLSMDIPERAENIFWHPPYHSMIQYSDSQYRSDSVEAQYGLSAETVKADDLSRCPNWETFIKRLNACMFKQFAALERGGRMFTLVGDMKKQGRLYSMILDMAKPGTIEQVVIKLQHNCVSDSRTYCGSFIPIVHEYLLITRKDQGLIVPISFGVHKEMDIRQSRSASWRDIIHTLMEDTGETSLENLYERLKDSPKNESNPHWKEKIRQTVQDTKYFRRTARGTYALTA